MTDMNSSGPALPVVPAPSPVPLNISSFIRLIAGVASGALIAYGHANPNDAATWGGIIGSVLTGLWILYKNTNAAKTLADWMTSEPVTLVTTSLLSKARSSTTTTGAAILLMLCMLPMAGCSTLASLAPKVATNSPVNPPTNAQVALVAGDYAFDLAYNTAANLFVANLPTLNQPGNAAAKAQAKALLASMLTCKASTTAGAPPVCTGYVATADAAAAAGDQTTLTAQIAQINFLTCEVTQLIKPSGATCTAP